MTKLEETHDALLFVVTKEKAVKEAEAVVSAAMEALDEANKVREHAIQNLYLARKLFDGSLEELKSELRAQGANNPTNCGTRAETAPVG